MQTKASGFSVSSPCSRLVTDVTYQASVVGTYQVGVVGWSVVTYQACVVGTYQLVTDVTYQAGVVGTYQAGVVDWTSNHVTIHLSGGTVHIRI